MVGVLVACCYGLSFAADVQCCDVALLIINLDSMTVSLAGTGNPYPEEWRTSSDEFVVDVNAQLLEKARACGALVVYAYGDYPHLYTGNEPISFPESIRPTPADILIPRSGASTDVFEGTVLLDTLQSHGIQHIVISGVHTGYCIWHSALAALRNGLDVTIVADGHSGGSPSYAGSYNAYWPSIGIHVVPLSELDFGLVVDSS